MCSLDAHDDDEQCRMGPCTGDVKPGCSICTCMHALQGKDMAGPTQACFICCESSLCALRGKDVAGPDNACCKSSSAHACMRCEARVLLHPFKHKSSMMQGCLQLRVSHHYFYYQPSPGDHLQSRSAAGRQALCVGGVQYVCVGVCKHENQGTLVEC